MRIKRFDMKAFGPFTNRTLTFDSEAPGLHIILGANEAGKSCSLRALKAFLYGFPHQISDNFQHANNQLLVGGCIEDNQGRELVFHRRKKKTADLLDMQGNPIDSAPIAALMNGIEEALFESLYGIDHKALVAGGKDILSQKGEVGQALFSAGAGISSLKKVLDALEAETDELFKDRGSKQQITQAINKYNELKNNVKEATLLPAEWKEHRKRLENAVSLHEELKQEIQKKNTELQRLTRLGKAIPGLAELENLQKQLQTLGPVVVLPPEFSSQVRESERGIREINLQIDKDKSRLTKLQEKQNGISLNRTLLDHGERIENLHQRLGSYQKSQKERVKLDGMKTVYGRDAEALLALIRPDLTLEKADSLRPVLSRKKTIQELSSRYAAMSQQALQAQKQINAAEDELKSSTDILSTLKQDRDSTGLAKAVKLAQRAGDIDDRIEKLSRQIASESKNILAELKRLGLWRGELEQLLELPLPLSETVNYYEALYRDFDQNRRQFEKDRHKEQKDLNIAETEVKAIAYAGEVPTTQELEAARKKREDGWKLLRRLWVDGKDVSKEAREYEPNLPLHDAYEKEVASADIIADRLRREADRVTKAASLQAKIEGIEKKIQEIIQFEKELSSRKSKIDTKWLNEWKPAGITPRTPAEMHTWLTEIEKLRYNVRDLIRKRDEMTAKENERKEYREMLEKALEDLDENEKFPDQNLSPILTFAEITIENIIRHKTDREKLSSSRKIAHKALKSAQQEKEETEKAALVWREKWKNAVTGMGLEEKCLPSEALDLLETISNLFEMLDKINVSQRQIDDIDLDICKFREEATNLFELVATELKNVSLDQGVTQLHAMLSRVRQDNELWKNNSEEIEFLKNEIGNAEKTLSSLEKRMAELLMIAKSSNSEELAEAITRSIEFQRLNEKISDVESNLAKLCEGVPLEKIKQQATDVNVDELSGQIAALEREIKHELEPRIEEYLKQIGEEKKELELMDGSGRAAEAAEELEQVAAKIRRLVDQYTKIRLASKLLKDEIERYRKERQDPVLQSASRLFSELTLGSFSALRTDVDSNDRAILVGVRPDGSRIPVEGMSDGTRDQLYLSLRLATLESRLETSAPMPFIVDDILINFDDERSKATLDVLAELARKNQVILFTHHRQIAQEAKKINAHEVVRVHKL